METIVKCQSCGNHFTRQAKRGRPAVRCESCRANNETKSEETVSAAAKETVAENAPEQIKPEPKVDNYPYLYRLMVGNLGLAYAGEEEQEANRLYNSYVRKSTAGYGQIGFETVQLWRLDKEANEYKVEKEFRPEQELR
jgi:hypothetical protein